MNELQQFLKSPKGIKDYYFEIVFKDADGLVLGTFRSDSMEHALTSLSGITKQRTHDLVGNTNSASITLYPRTIFENVFARADINIRKDDKIQLPAVGGPSQNVAVMPDDTGTANRNWQYRDGGINQTSGELFLVPRDAQSFLVYNIKDDSTTLIANPGTMGANSYQPYCNENKNTWLVVDQSLGNNYIVNVGLGTTTAIDAYRYRTGIGVGDYFYVVISNSNNQVELQKLDAVTGSLVGTYTTSGRPDTDATSDIVYVPSENKLYIVADNSATNDLYSYDLATDTFSGILATFSVGSSGAFANYMAYDSGSHKLLISSNSSSGTHSWLYDIAGDSLVNGPLTQPAEMMQHFDSLGIAYAIYEYEDGVLWDIATNTILNNQHYPGSDNDYLGAVHREGDGYILLFKDDGDVYTLQTSSPYTLNTSPDAGVIGDWADSNRIQVVSSPDGSAVASYTSGNSPSQHEMGGYVFAMSVSNAVKSQNIFSGEVAPPIKRDFEGKHEISLRTMAIESSIEGKLSRSADSAKNHVKWIIENHTHLTVDEDSFTNLADTTSVTLTDVEGEFIDLINEMCWLGTFALYIDSNVVSAKKIQASPSADMILDLDDCFEIKHTMKEESDVYTAITVNDADGNTINFKRNDNTWGDRSYSFQTDVNVVFSTEVTDAVNYWLYQYAYMWKRFELKMPWRYSGLEPFDIVLLNNLEDHLPDRYVQHQRLFWDGYFKAYIEGTASTIGDTSIMCYPEAFTDDYAGLFSYGTAVTVRLTSTYEVQLCVKYASTINGPWSVAIWETDDPISINTLVHIKAKIADREIHINGVSVPVTKIVSETVGHTLTDTEGELQIGLGKDFPEDIGSGGDDYQFTGYIDNVYADNRTIIFDKTTFPNGEVFGWFVLAPLPVDFMSNLYARVLTNVINTDGTCNLLLETNIDVLTQAADDRYWVGNGDTSNIELLGQSETTTAGTFKFQWRPTINGFTAYELDIEKNGAAFHNDNTLTALEKDVALTLSENNTYTWKVRGYINGSWTNWSYVSQFRYEDDGSLFGGFDPVSWTQQAYANNYGPEYMTENNYTAQFTAVVDTQAIRLMHGTNVYLIAPQGFYPATYTMILPPIDSDGDGENDLTYKVQALQSSGVWGVEVESEDFIPHPGPPSAPSFGTETWTGSTISVPINIPSYASYITLSYRYRQPTFKWTSSSDSTDPADNPSTVDATKGFSRTFFVRVYTIQPLHTDDQVLFSQAIPNYATGSVSKHEVHIKVKASNLRGESTETDQYFRSDDPGNNGVNTNPNSSPPGTDGGGSGATPDGTNPGGTGGPPTTNYDNSNPGNGGQNESSPEDSPDETETVPFTPSESFQNIPHPEGAVSYWGKTIYRGFNGSHNFGGSFSGVATPGTFGVRMPNQFNNQAAPLNSEFAGNLASYAKRNDGSYPSDFNGGTGFPGAALDDWPSAVFTGHSLYQVQFYDAEGNKVGPLVEGGGSTVIPSAESHPYSVSLYWGLDAPSFAAAGGPDIPDTFILSP